MATKCTCIRDATVTLVLLRDPLCPATLVHELADLRAVCS